jgi:arginase
MALQAQQFTDTTGAVQVALIKMPYTGARNVPEISGVPDYLEGGGLGRRLGRMGATVRRVDEVELTSDEQREYGEWHRMGMANGHLAEIVAKNVGRGQLSVGLLANCTSLLGVLGGLQHAMSEPQRVGLVFIDAHGDFNTPETTLSGMLGGMPVAVSAGLALRNLRLESGLDPALSTEHILMVGAVHEISVDDVRNVSARLHEEMRRLSSVVDVIYVHVDMDVLDPEEVSGHSLTVPDGPTSQELGAAITAMFGYEKVAAFGVASTPANERDPDGKSLQAAYRLVEAAVAGVQGRDGSSHD